MKIPSNIDFSELYDGFDVRKDRMMSYVTPNKPHTIAIIPSSFKIKSDEQGHSKQNIVFEGKLIDIEISKYKYRDVDAHIIFPRISFLSMLHKHFNTRYELENFMKGEFAKTIVFVLHNKKGYEIKEIKNG